jgi:hypothetical protein
VTVAAVLGAAFDGIGGWAHRNRWSRNDGSEGRPSIAFTRFAREPRSRKGSDGLGTAFAHSS